MRRLNGPDRRLTIAGAARRELSRQELLAVEQHERDLPIACVDGWSTTQRWSGVPPRDLAPLVEAAPESVLRVE
jgi:DMSO/TMAO reductase YedYZ molybdopterin-dependent catalytic subunit